MRVSAVVGRRARATPPREGGWPHTGAKRQGLDLYGTADGYLETGWAVSGSLQLQSHLSLRFLSPPTEDDCTVLFGWHIDQGHFGGVHLGGLNAALDVHSPGAMTETPRKAALQMDARASEAEKNALIEIFAGQAGGHPTRLGALIGEALGVSSFPIEVDSLGPQRSVLAILVERVMFA